MLVRGLLLANTCLASTLKWGLRNRGGRNIFQGFKDGLTDVRHILIKINKVFFAYLHAKMISWLEDLISRRKYFQVRDKLFSHRRKI